MEPKPRRVLQHVSVLLSWDTQEGNVAFVMFGMLGDMNKSSGQHRSEFQSLRD